MYYGWRAKLGVITPANGTSMEMEFHEYVPDGVAVMTQRILFEKVDKEGLSALAGRSVEAAQILSSAKPDILLFGCTTGSLIQGLGYDAKLIAQLEKAAHIPAVTTSTALVAALKAMSIRKLVIATPYSDSVNQAEKQFLEDSGYEVLDIRGLGYTDPNCMPRTTTAEMDRLAKKWPVANADAVVVSCTGIQVMDGLSAMDADFQKPVLTSNQVSLWYTLQKLGIHESNAPGSLFRLL